MRRRKERLPSSATSLPRLTRDLALPAVGRVEGLLSTFSFELLTSFFEFLTPFLSTFQPSNLRTFQPRPAPNSFPVTLLCNPLQLTPYPSHSYKNNGGHPLPNFHFHFSIFLSQEEGFSQDCRIEDSYFSSQSIGSRQTASMSDIGREQGWAGRCPSSRRRPLAPGERASFTIGARVLKF